MQWTGQGTLSLAGSRAGSPRSRSLKGVRGETPRKNKVPGGGVVNFDWVRTPAAHATAGRPKTSQASQAQNADASDQQTQQEPGRSGNRAENVMQTRRKLERP
jgi:hypothetical protein